MTDQQTPAPAVERGAFLRDLRTREVQRLHAAFSTRSWHDAEKAGNELRDKIDRFLTEEHLRLRAQSAAPQAVGVERLREALEKFVSAYEVSGGVKSGILHDALLEARIALATPSASVPERSGMREVGKVADLAKYADMTSDEKAVAMADDCAGDPWELLGFFREKLRQSEWLHDHASKAALSLACEKVELTRRLRAAPSTPKHDVPGMECTCRNVRRFDPTCPEHSSTPGEPADGEVQS